MPCNIAHPSPSTHAHPGSTKPLHSTHGARTTSVCQCRDLALPPQIPNNSVPCAAGRRQSILNVMVPCKCRDLVELGAARPWRVGLAWVLKVPDIDLQDASAPHRMSAARYATSPLTAPEENRFVWIGLKSRPRMGPVCVLLRSMSDSDGLDCVLRRPVAYLTGMHTHSALATIFSGSQMSSSPFSMPATITPLGRSPLT